MRVFLAGATGVIGRALIPKLIAEGHTITAMTRSETRAAELRKGSIEAVVCDAFDEQGVIDAVVRSKPDAVIHQLTALPRKMNPRHVSEDAAATNRLRIEGTRNLIAGAHAAGARRFVAQSIAFVTRPQGPAIADEVAPIYRDAPIAFRGVFDAVASLEEQTLAAPDMTGIVLRYGFLYGPGTAFDEHEAFAEGIDHRRIPLVGQARGVWSFVHVEDAADATVAALGDVPSGIYNIVDDDPALAREWIPYVAEVRHAPPPIRIPVWLARLGAGSYGVYLMNELRGASNKRAKSAFGWAPKHPSWREGFRASTPLRREIHPAP